MASIKKPICIHFHIFKNAGTTIDTVLKRNFSKDAVTMDTGIPDDILSWTKVLDHIKEKNPTTKSFSSHQLKFPLPKSAEYQFLPMIFIRHPIDRAFSMYSFDKRRTSFRDITTVVKAKSTDLAGYIKWNLRLKNHMVMKNYQVLSLSDKPRGSTVDEKDLELVIDRIKNFLVIGIVDRMAESLIMAEKTLGKYFDVIDLSFEKQNISQDRTGDLEQRLKTGRNEIGAELMDRLEKENEFDLKLYSMANQILNERIKELTDFDTRMTDFKNRCKKRENIP